VLAFLRIPVSASAKANEESRTQEAQMKDEHGMHLVYTESDKGKT